MPLDRASKTTLDLLRRFESRNVTFVEKDGSWPIVWERAKGVYVWDVDGRRYLDLTAGFGVAAAGHANGSVVRAGRAQMGTLLHAMGDVHPHPIKAKLARELSRLTFERWSRQARRKLRKTTRSTIESGKVIFCNSGFEAVEVALKTARLATGRDRVIAFEGAYHGLGYGALTVTHRRHFRGPFQTQLGQFGCFLPFPKDERDLVEIEGRLKFELQKETVGAVLVEPIQTRGGINVPPKGFLEMLRRWCKQFGALLVLDEIYTGFGRTGAWFCCEHESIVPDMICLGKALTGGFPLSVCVGRARVMDKAWPLSSGEAIHTSTFLGHPVGCAMALAQIQELRSKHLVPACQKIGAYLRNHLLEAFAHRRSVVEIRGRGLLLGIELRDPQAASKNTAAIAMMKQMLASGYILLPEGEHANVISFTPPLVIQRSHVDRMVRTLERVYREVVEP